jgi:hypothetical protein
MPDQVRHDGRTFDCQADYFRSINVVFFAFTLMI